MTDPSYAGQIVTLTYPHIGNTGVNDEDVEAVRVHAAGLVIRDLPVRASNFRAQCDLSSYLQQQGVVGIADIDTRKLTRRLREGGAQAGCIVAADALDGRAIERALQRARSYAGMAGQDLAKVVSVERPYQWKEEAGVSRARTARPDLWRANSIVSMLSRTTTESNRIFCV